MVRIRTTKMASLAYLYPRVLAGRPSHAQTVQRQRQSATKNFLAADAQVVISSVYFVQLVVSLAKLVLRREHLSNQRAMHAAQLPQTRINRRKWQHQRDPRAAHHSHNSRFQQIPLPSSLCLLLQRKSTTSTNTHTTLRNHHLLGHLQCTISNQVHAARPHKQCKQCCRLFPHLAPS
jgi:hypothetical protein